MELNSFLVPGIRVFWDSYLANGSTKLAKEAMSFQLREERLESKLQLVNYVLWAIPSVGFWERSVLVRLLEADQALSGNIAVVALNLGIAFNSTFVALILSFPHLPRLYA